MQFNEEDSDSLNEFLKIISASTHPHSTQDDINNELISEVKQTSEKDPQTSSSGGEKFALFGTSANDTTQSYTPGCFVDSLSSPFVAMSAPALAIEPPTPNDDMFQLSTLTASSRELSRLQTQFESPLKASFNLNGSRGFFNASPTGTFSSSPTSSQATLFGSPGISHGSPSPGNAFSIDNPSADCSAGFGLPIARSNIKESSELTALRQKRSGHQRDFSGASSTTSLATAQVHGFCPAIDPSALQPPLSNLNHELRIPRNGLNQIVSPFINQTVEHGPDGAMTGRYQRPLTSTGRPSHARKTPPGHVKRPRNAFILFRSHACSSNLIPPTVEKDHRQISRIVSHMWKNLPVGERIKWEREAEAEKELHRKLHPDYRYKPVYRKENPAKKKQGASNSVSSPKKKSAAKKRTQGANHNEADGRALLESTDDGSAFCKKTSAELRQERDEEIRCEAVAKVVMETRLCGIHLDEGQLEQRVTEEVRLVQRKDAIMAPRRDAFEGNEQPDPFPTLSERSADSSTMPTTGISKPNGKLPIPAPLQARRKSQLNRANSAPPPPSPLRTMHAREVVYNPKARGSRELSPDFPKPRATAPEGDVQMDEMIYRSDYLTPQVSDHDPSLRVTHDYSRFTDPNARNMPFNNYQFNLTPSQELDQLFHSPDFTFADVNCFSVESSLPTLEAKADALVPSVYPTVQDVFAEPQINFNGDPSVRLQLENYTFDDAHYATSLNGAFTGVNKDPGQINLASLSNCPIEKALGVENAGSHGKQPAGGSHSREHFSGGSHAAFTNHFSSNMTSNLTRRRSSVIMSFSEDCSDRTLAEAVESAKRNASLVSVQREHTRGASCLAERRQSVVLSGLGEFPIIDLDPHLPAPIHVEHMNPSWLDAQHENTQTLFPSSGSLSAAHFVAQNEAESLGMTQSSEEAAFASFLHPFDISSESSSVGGSEPPEASKNDHATVTGEHNGRNEVPRQIPREGRDSETIHSRPSFIEKNQRSLFPALPVPSGVGEDGQTYLFLTKEQAATEGLIDQIRAAGYGVTYEYDELEADSGDDCGSRTQAYSTGH